MSDLGAIFHVKKDGVQYDAHAYTTTDECPYPNLKIKFKGQQAYVKMEQGKGNGDVPCYAKDKAGVIYQVKKEAVPTGSVTWQGNYSRYTLVIPKMVKVIKVWSNIIPGSSYNAIINGKDFGYVGVTPGETYTFQLERWRHKDFPPIQELNCYDRSSSSSPHLGWIVGDPKSDVPVCTISWSPEINKQKPNFTDYH